MLKNQALRCLSGKQIPCKIDSICIHGDTLNAINTAKLVKDSSYVFSHASSTAANFAIIFKKPLIYLITDEMNKNYLTYTRHEIKKEIFNQNFLNISNLKMNSLPRMFKIDQTRYNNYYKNYINSCKNKNKELSQVVFERLN